MPKTEPVAKPLRVTPKVAAEMCSMSYERFILFVRTSKLFTILPRRPGQRGVGKRYFLVTEEVEIYATKGEEALRQFRDKKKRQTRISA